MDPGGRKSSAALRRRSLKREELLDCFFLCENFSCNPTGCVSDTDCDKDNNNSNSDGDGDDGGDVGGPSYCNMVTGACESASSRCPAGAVPGGTVVRAGADGGHMLVCRPGHRVAAGWDGEGGNSAPVRCAAGGGGWVVAEGSGSTPAGVACRPGLQGVKEELRFYVIVYPTTPFLTSIEPHARHLKKKNCLNTEKKNMLVGFLFLPFTGCSSHVPCPYGKMCVDKECVVDAICPQVLKGKKALLTFLKILPSAFSTKSFYNNIIFASNALEIKKSL